jgi:hypothetical protein
MSAVAFIGVAVLLCSFGGARPQDKTKDPKEMPAYADVQKDAKKHIGKKVSWVGKPVRQDTLYDQEGRKVEDTFIFVCQDEKGQFPADNPLIVKLEKLKITAAAEKGDKTGPFLVSGTIRESRVLDPPIEGSTRKKITAPVLVDVTIDMPPAKDK